jgi:hypothetical protein
MLRIPNPGSDIDSFLRIFHELFEALREQATFNLDDMTEVLVKRNLATSSGYMGAEAMRRSYNEDRSLDGLFNQSKMYSELYKALGWFQPTPKSALIFQFTYLGAHVAAAKRDPPAIFKESILGLAYPTPNLAVKGSYILRPFVTILRTMAELDGLLCRDEMIVGPLCLENDRDQANFDAMIAELKSIRRHRSHLEAKIQAVSRERDITSTTMGNYTRFPMAVMTWTGWTTKESRRDYYNKATIFLVLTEEGRRELQRVKASRDIRAADIQAADERTKAAIVRIAFYQLLDNAGFDTAAVQAQITSDLAQAARFLGNTNTPLLFSPFQELNPEYINPLFPKVSGTKEAESPKLDTLDTQAILPQLFSKISLISPAKSAATQVSQDLAILFTDAASQVGNNLSLIADNIAAQYLTANKSEFYPLIVNLFRELGYNCELSRVGVNYQRIDAIIIDPLHSIPVEIKSPGEELFLSVKAVRQALENKVVLLSRFTGNYPTQPTTTSLVIGYNPPNDRSEVATLVADIHKSFGIVVGVIDLRSLLFMVAATVLEGKTHNAEDLRNLHGIIKIADA